MRPGLGPIFAHERAVTARRWQSHALRVVCGLMLLGAMIVAWYAQLAGRSFPSIRAEVELGRWYFYALTGMQLSLVLLVAPAVAAGAICEDRAKGVLAHLLVTDLSDAEIVLGKLAARLAPVLELVVCSIPVACLAALLGGVEPRALAMAFLVAAVVAVLGGSLALALSIGARTTHQALLGVYATWAILLLIQPVWQALGSAGLGIVGPPPWVLRLNPCWLSFAFYLEPVPTGWGDFTPFLIVALGASIVLAGLSITRLRGVTATLVAGIRPRRSPERLSALGRLIRSLPGPSLDGNPVLWREWRRHRPAGRGGFLGPAFAAGYALATIASLVHELRYGDAGGQDDAGVAMLFLLMFGLLMLSASAATSLSEERVRRSLDVLLATPLRTRSILWGKWWGTFRAAPLLALAPVALAAVLVFGWRQQSPSPPPFPAPDRLAAVCIVGLMAAVVLAHGAVITSLGLALATWLPRQGHAVALCTTYFVAVGLGWPILTSALVSVPGGSDLPAMRVASLSPFFGVVCLLNNATFATPHSTADLACVAGWTVILAAVAASLFAAAYLSFDRCLGRISDWRDELAITSRERNTSRIRSWQWSSSSA